MKTVARRSLHVAVVLSLVPFAGLSIASLRVETGRDADGHVEIAGRDTGQQLIVTVERDGRDVDVARQASYVTKPAGIVAVDASGWVTPLVEGKTTLTVQLNNQQAELDVVVSHLEEDVPINFANQIVPIFTKYGCNGGGCHGKSGGQNGFRLSLLGFEPTEDFEYLLKEGRGRRLFPAAPDRSLLLSKAVAAVPHGGGQRIDKDSPAYRLLRRWVAQGMPYGNADDPIVDHIKVLPKQRTMQPGTEQQLTVVAHYSDGSTQDVTRMTTLESNDSEMAEVNETGLVQTLDQTGTVAVMARFQGHVGVFRATLPAGIVVDNLPEPKNYVDQHVFAQLTRLGLPPSHRCDDATFLRRTGLTIAGRLPTLEEAIAFESDASENKREAWIDNLLASTDYADHFAGKWNAILRNKRRNNNDKRATFAFHRWIRDSFHNNKPYDEFVREIIAASGEVTLHPPVAWYRELKDSSSLVEDTAQLFLGLRIQCARCHHHPFEKWSQQDYYGLSAFFSQVGRKKSDFQNQDRIYHRVGVATAKNPKNGQPVKPSGLGSDSFEVDSLDDPRHALVDWMVADDNPFFAKALVNRYWKHFFGRGLVDPEDDMRVTNPASNPELLEALASDFVASGYDLKRLVRTIAVSETFQRSAIPNEHNKKDKQAFSRYYAKRLEAEQLLDAIDTLTAAPTKFDGVPVSTRAVQLPDNGFNSYFLTVFGRPESSSACECERSSDANLAQSLHLINSTDIQNKITADSGRAAKLAADTSRNHEQKLYELYMTSFSRPPTPDEIAIATAYISRKEQPREAYEDIVWALINTKEFLFNH